jgi:hypothetical protein
MRCGEEFDCQSIGICGANYNVMANIVKPDGTIVEHCPRNPDWDWIRAYGKRLAAQSAPVEEVARKIATMLGVQYTDGWGKIADILYQHGFDAQGHGVGQLAKLAIQACDGFDAQPNHGAPEAKRIMDDLRKAAQFFSPVPSPESATKEGK